MHEIRSKSFKRKIRDFKNVEELSIPFNNIGKTGALELFRLKNDFSSLDILFHGNKITDVGEMDAIEQSARSQPYKP